MTHNSRLTGGFWWMVPLLAATLACALPGQGPGPSQSSTPAGGGAPTGSEGLGTAQTAPTGTAVYVGTAGEGPPVDLCTLATPAEVEAVLGGPATRTVFSEGGQTCVLSLDDTHLLIVQAGHDADGKTLHVGGMGAQRGNVTDPAALQVLADIEAQQATLTLPQLVEKALPFWRAAGFSAEVQPGVGDWAYWFYGSQAGFGNLAEIGTGRASGAWLGLYTIATDEAAARAMLVPLAVTLLSRLPDDFTITGTSQ